MSSRRHRERSKRDDSQSFHLIHDWNRRPRKSEPEPGNPNLVQDKDRHHRSTRRVPDVSGELPASSASYPYQKSSTNREQSHYTPTQGAGYYNPPDYATLSNPLTQVQPAPLPMSSHTHSRDPEPYDSRAYIKAQKKSSKRSPPSSDEKALATEQARMAQSSQDQRQNPVPGSSAPQLPASTQTYWIPAAQPTRDPGNSTRHRDRDEERERKRDKERRREKEKEKEKERERERRKAQEEELAREAEKQKEKERRREERRRLKLAEENRKYDEERERQRQDRRHRKAKEEEARKRQEARPADPSAGYASATTITKHKTPKMDDKTSLRQPYSDQIPSSSSNIALPSTQYASTTHNTSTRPQVPTDARRGVDYSSEREKRKIRPPRDRAQPNESGVSSSEQEHSGRERGMRTTGTTERRRDYHGDNPSGPSGSENERAGRERRVPRRQPANDGYVDATAHIPNTGQTTLPVGHAAFANHIPHVVSIRAGQGPADPQTPLQPTRSQTAPTTTSRQLDSQGNDAGYTPAGLVRSSTIPHGAFLHPNTALSMTHQTNLAVSSHPHHGHSSGATTQRNETQGAALSSAHAYSALPGGSLEAPARPPSARPPGHSVAPNGTPGYSYSRQQLKPSPPQANQALNSKAELSHLYPHSTTDNQSAHFAKLSVYHSPDPPVSADLYVSNKYAAPPHTQYQSVHQSTPPYQGPEPSPGEDTPRAAPLPIPEPRRVYSSTPGPPPAPDQSPTVQPYDPRSPKQNVSAPGQILSASPWQNSRNQVFSPGQAKTTTLPSSQIQDSPPVGVDSIHPHSTSRAAQLPSQSAAANGSTSSHSPRNAQVSSLRGGQGSSGTPKQSPSGRLRNGSNDTIATPNVTKQSPSSASYRPLNQTNHANAQLHAHAQSRPDTTTRGVTSMTSGYPDNARYRSQAPSYPLANSSSQPQSSANVLSSSVNQTQANIPASVPHPSQSQSHSYSRNPPQPTNPASHLPSTDYPIRNHPEPSITGYAPAQDYSQRAHATSTPATTGSSAAAIAAAYRSGAYHREFSRTTEPSSAPPTQTTHRIPPKSAPSPAPSARHYSNPLATSTPGSAYPQGIAAPTPVRGQAYPVAEPGRGRSTSTPAPSTFHNRTPSESQANAPRVAVAGHSSTPAPTKHHPPNINTSLSPATEQDPLRTPSSLAPSMLHRGNSITSIRNVAAAAAPVKEKESRKRGGFLGLFRSRSSPPKQAEVRPPAMPKEVKNRPRANSQTTINGIAASVKNIVSPHPHPHHQPTVTPHRPPTARPEQQVPQSAPPTQTSYPQNAWHHVQQQQPQPIIAPTPIPADHRNSNINGKMFTPFRLLSKRHRTVSAASVEAQDGTAANTVIDSTRSSTAGRPSPPLRDPAVATTDWREQEAVTQSMRKSTRRHRPGVTFEMYSDLSDNNRQRNAM